MKKDTLIDIAIAQEPLKVRAFEKDGYVYVPLVEWTLVPEEEIFQRKFSIFNPE